MLWHRVLVASCLFLAALKASPVWAQSAKPKEGPLGMKFVPLPKATFYMGGGGGKAGKKTEIKEGVCMTCTATFGNGVKILRKKGARSG